MIRVGFGEKNNLSIHYTSKACKNKQGMKGEGQKKASESSSKAHHNLRTFVHH